MATNLVSLVMQFLTPEMIGRIAAALGLDRSSVQSAIGAAVPALLAGFSSTAAQPGGAQRLADATRQQMGALGNFDSMLGAGGQASFIEKGSQMLASLIGGGDQAALAGAVGKFSGLSQGVSGSLLGMLAPVVMGTIGQQQGTRDASGIAGFLASQKDNIAAALPSGFGNLLGGTGLLDALGGTARAAAAAGSQAARAATSAAYSIGDAGQRATRAAASASYNWLYWLVPVAAAVALLAYFFAAPTERVAERGVTPVPSVTVGVGGFDAGRQVTESISTLRTTLGGITDAASARAALPKLQEITAQIDKVGGVTGQLSTDQRKALAGLVNPAMPALNQLFDKILAIPGAGVAAKPTIDALKAKLAALGRAPV